MNRHELFHAARRIPAEEPCVKDQVSHLQGGGYEERCSQHLRMEHEPGDQRPECAGDLDRYVLQTGRQPATVAGQTHYKRLAYACGPLVETRPERI